MLLVRWHSCANRPLNVDVVGVQFEVEEGRSGVVLRFDGLIAIMNLSA